jgi:hypothetical protein
MVSFAKVYVRKNALTAADLLNDRILPLYEEQRILLLLVLTYRGTKFKGSPQHHEYKLYLEIEGIEHSKTQVRHPRSNGMFEHLHPTMQEEFYAVG